MRALSPTLVTLALLAACDSLPPPPSEETQRSGAACGSAERPWGSPGCARSGAPPAAPAAPGLPNTVIQVEVSGKVVVPADAPAGRLLVVLMDGPCFVPGSHFLGMVQPGASATYMMSAFPPVGTGLEACGALIEPLRSGVSWWGRADRGTMAVQGRGKMVYQGTDIPLRHLREVQLPAAVKPAR